MKKEASENFAGCHGMSPLLNVRPHAIDGESWPGYLLRLSQSNGLDGLKDLARILTFTELQLIAGDAREILPLLGVQFTDYELINRVLGQPEPRRKIRYVHVARMGRSVRSRVCPLCLASDDVPYVRAAWEHPLALVCEKHQISLRDRCESCEADITIQRSRVESCDCGSEFTQQSTDVVPTWFGQLKRVFQEAFSEASTETFSKATWKGIKAIEVMHWITASYGYNATCARSVITDCP